MGHFEGPVDNGLSGAGIPDLCQCIGSLGRVVGPVVLGEKCKQRINGWSANFARCVCSFSAKGDPGAIRRLRGFEPELFDESNDRSTISFVHDYRQQLAEGFRRSKPS